MAARRSRPSQGLSRSSSASWWRNQPAARRTGRSGRTQGRREPRFERLYAGGGDLVARQTQGIALGGDRPLLDGHRGAIGTGAHLLDGDGIVAAVRITEAAQRPAEQ